MLSVVVCFSLWYDYNEEQTVDETEIPTKSINIWTINREYGDMILSSIKINENLEEEVARPVAGFPHWACYEDVSLHPGGYVPWHWHADVEFSWALQGGIRLDTANHSFTVRMGEGAFINSNMLHYKEPLAGPPPIMLDQLFDVRLLSGYHKSVFEQKYIMPVIECRELEAMVFRPSQPNQRRILELLRHAYDTAELAGYGYEFEVRNDLSTVWSLLCRETEGMIQSGKVSAGQGEQRIKRMMTYIRDHYRERIALEEIARAASISQRECLRCFRQNLNTTPFTYLLEYRVRRACEQLRESDRSITDISYECGFSGTSYFSKTFKKLMACTPSEYREMCKQAGGHNRFMHGVAVAGNQRSKTEDDGEEYDRT